MINIITRSIFIAIISFAIINVISYIVISNDYLVSDLNKETIGADAYNAIDLSKYYYPDRNTVILGDSVARQIITKGLAGKINVIDLTCNQALSLAGHYSLLLNVLNHNPQVSKVYLLYHIGSFSNNLDEPWTYNYFVKPFYLENDSLFSDNIHTIIKRKFYWPLYKLPIARVLPCFGSIDYSHKDTLAKYRPIMSPTSIEYIQIIQKLCRARNVEFKIFPTPISFKAGISFHDFNILVRENNLCDTFNKYLDRMIVLDDDFFVDRVHFKEKYIKIVSEFSMNYVGLLEESLHQSSAW